VAGRTAGIDTGKLDRLGRSSSATTTRFSSAGGTNSSTVVLHNNPSGLALHSSLLLAVVAVRKSIIRTGVLAVSNSSDMVNLMLCLISTV
jgi:hypothetical protein